MRAMQLTAAGQPLALVELERPTPGPGELRLRVTSCGICRTDLHLTDGELPLRRTPLVPGHQIVGRVDQLGPDVRGFALGDRVGVPWLAWTCGTCAACRGERENLCPRARFTGWDQDGGFAEACVVDADFAFPLPDLYDDVAVAPLLCGGLIGYRALRLAGPAARLGIYGFGAAGHLVAQLARHHGQEVFAFTRDGDDAAQALARRHGVAWAGPSSAPPPVPLDAAIVFAPVGALVPRALAAVGPGGTVVLGGIHMSELPAMPYQLLWQERVLRSVTNLTRRDAVELLELAPRVPLLTETTPYPLAAAGRALADLREGRLTGAAVLVP